jgi:hypothetical protein
MVTSGGMGASRPIRQPAESIATIQAAPRPQNPFIFKEFYRSFHNIRKICHNFFLSS